MLIIAITSLIISSFCKAQTIYSQTYDGSNDFDDLSNGDVVLIKVSSGEYLEEVNGVVKLRSTQFDQESMLWEIKHAKSGNIKFKNMVSGNYLKGQDDDSTVVSAITGYGYAAEWKSGGESELSGSPSFDYGRRYVRIQSDKQDKCLRKSGTSVELEQCYHYACEYHCDFTFERMNNDGSD